MIKNKNGQIAGSQTINMIYRCFEELDDSDQLKFVKSLTSNYLIPNK